MKSLTLLPALILALALVAAGCGAPEEPAAPAAAPETPREQQQLIDNLVREVDELSRIASHLEAENESLRREVGAANDRVILLRQSIQDLSRRTDNVRRAAGAISPEAIAAPPAPAEAPPEERTRNIFSLILFIIVILVIIFIVIRLMRSRSEFDEEDDDFDDFEDDDDLGFDEDEEEEIAPAEEKGKKEGDEKKQ